MKILFVIVKPNLEVVYQTAERGSSFMSLCHSLTSEIYRYDIYELCYYLTEKTNWLVLFREMMAYH
jgi:hypothetical protein